MIAAAPAPAPVSCAPTPASQVFAAYGDLADYSLLPDTTFAVGSGATVVTQSFCVGVEHPTFRFFASAAQKDAKLRAALRYTDAKGRVRDQSVDDLSGQDFAGGPTPTRSIKLATALPLRQDGDTLSVQLVLTAESRGDWAVDDVYIDPRARG